MSWVSLDKFKTVCEAIKNYVISQADDAYNKAHSEMDNYLPLSGGTMSGQLNMGNHKIANLSTGGVDTSATNKGYVDAADAKKLNLSGGTMTGALNVVEPTEDSNATTKKYVDDAIASSSGEGKYVLKTGDTMTGYLTLIENMATAADKRMHLNVQRNFFEIFDGPNKDAMLSSGSLSLTNDDKNTALFSALGSLTLNKYDNKKFYHFIHSEIYDAQSRRIVNRFGVTEDFEFAFTTELQDGTYAIDNASYLARILCGSPTLDNHAATKKYVDDALADKVSTTDEMTDTELNTILAIFN